MGNRVGFTLASKVAAAALMGLFCVAGCASNLDAAAHAERKVAPAPSGQVTIYRDPFGSPHLYAAREEDGFWGLGYAMAEDRAEGVLLYYLFLRGELAAAFGPGPIGDKPGVVVQRQFR